MEKNGLEQEIQEKLSELKQNFGLGGSAAQVVAEDEAIGGVPAPSSEKVDEERGHRAEEADK